MFLRINDLLLGGDEKYKIQAPVQGLAMAPIRASFDNYSGRSGGYISSQYYSPRQVVINGFYIGNTCDEAQTLRQNLIQALPIQQSLPLFITTFSGLMYVMDTYVIDFKMDITSPKSGVYQIVLLAPDPFLYDAGDGVDPDSGYVSSLFYKSVGGGYVTPYSLPVPWSEGTPSTIINNTGSVDIFPQIILEGAFTNPRVTNLTTGYFIELNMTTSGSDEILIDMKEREITLNGGSVISNRTSDSTWWTLLMGDNEIVLNTDSGSDTNFGTIRWRLGYEGI